MTLAELRRYAPEHPEAWEARLEEIGAAARYLAFAARRLDSPPASERSIDLYFAVLSHWECLPALDRSRWFARAWKLVTEPSK